MSRRGKEPNHHGVLVVDKPAGMTSHDVVAVVRRAAGQRRVGHTGTLDPDATGVLVLCLGRATRLVRFLQEGRKVYAARMVLGRETDSQDASGAIVAEHDASHVTESELCGALTAQVGVIQQVPPMVSAIKIDGERLHVKARRGEVVERPPRTVTIHDLVLEDFVAGTHPEAAFLVTCGPGTYVRTIAHDVGQALGVGGSLLELRRMANGGVTVDDAISLDDVRRHGEDGTFGSLLIPMPAAVADRPVVLVERDAAIGLAQGRRLPEELLRANDVSEVVAVVHEGMLVGLYGTDGRPEVVLVQPDDFAVAEQGA